MASNNIELNLKILELVCKNQHVYGVLIPNFLVVKIMVNEMFDLEDRLGNALKVIAKLGLQKIFSVVKL